MLSPFTFEHGGRSYTCTPEKGSGTLNGTWWWFNVSYDQQRYAPFEYAKGDTQSSVQSRIIAYYEHRLWAREQPTLPRNGMARPGRPAGSGKQQNGQNGAAGNGAAVAAKAAPAKK